MDFEFSPIFEPEFGKKLLDIVMGYAIGIMNFKYID
jgi:hypothetical protein